MSEERITVLAVDDEPKILDIFSQYLSEDDDFYVIKARSVGEALDILTHEDVSVIASDYQMPGTNGIEFFLFSMKKAVIFLLFCLPDADVRRLLFVHLTVERIFILLRVRNRDCSFRCSKNNWSLSSPRKRQMRRWLKVSEKTGVCFPSFG